jgi:hypothetical protein
MTLGSEGIGAVLATLWRKWAAKKGGERRRDENGQRELAQDKITESERKEGIEIEERRSMLKEREQTSKKVSVRIQQVIFDRWTLLQAV